MRAFASERFEVWRCAECGSIHARDEVDLDHYYAQYAFHSVEVDWRHRIQYDHLLSRLRRAGVEPGQTVLDYGCGGGHFVDHLRLRGYDAQGYDAYTERFADRSVLERRYDCVVSQDVIEHVPSPHAFLAELAAIVGAGGIVAIGTPNASAIDLRRTEDFEFPLHQPYHRHILSKQALFDAAQRQGLRLDRYYPTHFMNTRFPCLNSRFFLYYAGLCDNTVDCFNEPVRVGSVLARLPVSLFWAFFGSFFVPPMDVMAIFERA